MKESENPPVPKRVPVALVPFAVNFYQLAMLAQAMCRTGKVTEFDLHEAYRLLERSYEFMEGVDRRATKSFDQLLGEETTKVSKKPRTLHTMKTESSLIRRIKAAFVTQTQQREFDARWEEVCDKWHHRIWNWDCEEDGRMVFNQEMHDHLLNETLEKLNLYRENSRVLLISGRVRSSEEIVASRYFVEPHEMEIIKWACNEGAAEMSALEVKKGLRKGRNVTPAENSEKVAGGVNDGTDGATSEGGTV